MCNKLYVSSGIILVALISMTLAVSSVMAAENKNLRKDTRAKTQSPLKPKWVEEPSSFMGIVLGKSLSINAPIGCADSKPCSLSKKSYRDEFTVEVRKVNLLNDSVFVRTLDSTFDGPVGNIKITFERGSFSQVEEILTVKYGTPHQTKIEKLKTKGGAEFDNIVLLWLGEKVSIRAESFSERLIFNDGMIYDIGEINVFTADYLAKKSQESSNEAKRSAAGL